MKKHYPLILLTSTLLAVAPACSKDFWKPYYDRIQGGTWELHDVDRRGIGSGFTPAFTGGRFTFLDGGQLIYTDPSGHEFSGSWNIRKQYVAAVNNNVNSLTITAIDFQTQDVRTEHFDEIQFTGTNRFKAFIYYRSRTYVFRFKR